MQIKATLALGLNGTKQLVQRYTGRPACLRYRYDKTRQKCIKTLSLGVGEQDWVPGVIIPAGHPLVMKIGPRKAELRQQIKIAGGGRNPQQKAWTRACRKALKMSSEQRMMNELAAV